MRDFIKRTDVGAERVRIMRRNIFRLVLFVELISMSIVAIGTIAYKIFFN